MKKQIFITTLTLSLFSFQASAVCFGNNLMIIGMASSEEAAYQDAKNKLAVACGDDDFTWSQVTGPYIIDYQTDENGNCLVTARVPYKCCSQW